MTTQLPTLPFVSLFSDYADHRFPADATNTNAEVEREGTRQIHHQDTIVRAISSLPELCATSERDFEDFLDKFPSPFSDHASFRCSLLMLYGLRRPLPAAILCLGSCHCLKDQQVVTHMTCVCISCQIGSEMVKGLLLSLQ